MVKIIDLRQARQRRRFQKVQGKLRGSFGWVLSPFLAMVLIVTGLMIWEDIRKGGDIGELASVKINRSLPGPSSGNVPPGTHELTGRVSHVRDGDTIEIGGVPVRLSHLDCAELGTDAGARAKREMSRLVRGQRLTCDLTGRKSYDRHIGTCHLPDGRDLARAMRDRDICGG